MDKELKDKWIAALRSGKYSQGTGNLCMDGKYCCLGVLCEIMNLPRKQEGRWIFFEGQQSLIGPDNYAKIGGYDIQEKLVAMNDSGTPFVDIADYIETNL